MYSQATIISWLEENIQGMRKSRRTTLAVIVFSAMFMKGIGVLALGRAMAGEVSAKHCIKRVWRFFRNRSVETELVFQSILRCMIPAQRDFAVLADWTDLGVFQQLVFSLPKDGRAIPFLCVTVRKGTTKEKQKGSMIKGEQEALEILERILPEGKRPVIIADRGFANTRWLGDIQKRGWAFVQRIQQDSTLITDSHFGSFKELGIRRGWRPREHGKGTVFESHFGPVYAHSTFDREAKEPWFLVTSLSYLSAKQVVGLYKKRMWIEAMFRDLKNRNWGLGLDEVHLSEPERHDRHFLVVMLCYLFLIAFGAAAESQGIGEEFKANTRAERVMALARLGNYVMQIIQCPLSVAIDQLRKMPA